MCDTTYLYVWRDLFCRWVYMYFLIHIREIEDKTELNGVESYVYEKVCLLYIGILHPKPWTLTPKSMDPEPKPWSKP